MKVTIDFPYDTVENLINVLYKPDMSKEEFTNRIYVDLWDEYLADFFRDRSEMFEFLCYDPKLKKTKSIISKEQIELLWNLYLENKDTIDSAIQERIDQKEEHYRKIEAQIEEELKRKHDMYSSPDYIPPKNATPIIYKGKNYKSKAQCCYLENISKTQLNKYLNNYEKD